MAGKPGGIRIEMFGGLRVSHGETAYARFPAQQTGALLALLALNLHRPCTREELAAVLWPDMDVNEGRRSLRQTLFKLRHQLTMALPLGEELFLGRPHTILLDPGRVTTDVSEFEHAVQSAHCSPDSTERMRNLTLAEALYQGELLPGFYSEPIIAEQHRLDRLYQMVLHDLVVSLIESGETTDAMDIAMRSIDRDPTSEEAHSDLMRVYAAQGKPIAVMRQYRELERLLQEAFEEQPSRPVRELTVSLEAQASLGPNLYIEGGRGEACPARSPLVWATLASPEAGQAGDASLAPTKAPDETTPASTVSSVLGTDRNRESWKKSTTASIDVGAGLALPAATPTRTGSDPCPKPVAWSGSSLPVSTPHRSALRTVMSRRDAIGVAGVIIPLLLLLGVRAPLTARLRRPTPVLRAGSVSAAYAEVLVRPTSLVEARTVARHPIAEDVRQPFAPATVTHATRSRHVANLAAAIRHKPLHSPRTGAKLVRARTVTGVTTRLTPPGMEVWAQRVELKPGDRGNDATTVIPDPTGGVFVLGFVYTAKTDVDFLIVKYSAKGKVLWERRYNGPGNDTDRARSGAVDADGNLYVTGESDGGKGDGKGNHNAWDVATMKFDRNGNRLWLRRWAGPGNNADEPVKLCLDAKRNVYVTARSNFGDPPGTGFDWITLKYDTNGNEQWCRRFGGPGDDEPTDMAVDRAGNVYITGYESLQGRSKCVTLKYTTAGTQEWVRTYDSADYSATKPAGLALDRSGNVTIAATGCRATISDMLILKYDRYGRTLWLQRYHLGVVNVAATTGIAADSAGRICVLAASSPTYETHDDILTALFDKNGHLVWVNLLNGEAHRGSAPCGIAADAEGNFIVLGTVDNGHEEARYTANDYVTVKYAPNGKERWRRYYNGCLYYEDFARTLTVDRQGNAYSAGQSDSGGGRPGTIVTVKYAP